MHSFYSTFLFMESIPFLEGMRHILRLGTVSSRRWACQAGKARKGLLHGAKWSALYQAVNRCQKHRCRRTLTMELKTDRTRLSRSDIRLCPAFGLIASFGPRSSTKGSTCPTRPRKRARRGKEAPTHSFAKGNYLLLPQTFSDIWSKAETCRSPRLLQARYTRVV